MNNLVWTAVVAASLAFGTILSAVADSHLAVPLGLAAIASAILATRE